MQNKEIQTKIMVFGTFDGLHKGHLDFFKQARALKILVPGQARKPYLVVSIARDKNVTRIKGDRPILNEKKRFNLVKKCPLVDQVVLGGIKDYISHIKKIHPDFIGLGYDQVAYIKNLRKDLKQAGLLVKVFRLKPYKEKIYKNHLLKIKV